MATWRATSGEYTMPLCVVRKTRYSFAPAEMGLVDENRAVARGGKRSHEPAEPDGHVAGDHTQIALARPPSVALRQQHLMSSESQHAPAERPLRQISRREAPADGSTEQHDASRRQSCAARRGRHPTRTALEQFQNDQAAHAVADEVQGIGAQSA